jgi:hypothetical protein
MRSHFFLRATAVVALSSTLFSSAAVAAPVSGSVASASTTQLMQKAGVQINTEPSTPFSNDFDMGPTRFTLELAPGEETTIQVQITSRMSARRGFTFESEDFQPGTTESQAADLLGPQRGPYTARDWIHAAVPSLELDHGQRAFVPVTVTVPKDADPGDHYAALLLRRTPIASEKTDKGFEVISRVGALFLITVKGPVIRKTSIMSLTTRHKLYWAFPSYLNLRVKNEGTVYAMPEGVIQIRNILGFVVDEIPLKDWPVLRNSERGITLSWNPHFALGYYTARTKLTIYGETVPVVMTGFWMLPALPILLALFAIFLVSFLVQFFFSRFEISKKKK